jgi:hypothetical protein
VLVTGVEFGADGKPAVFVIQDSGGGTCSQRVTASQLEDMLLPQNPAVVTKKAVW